MKPHFYILFCFSYLISIGAEPIRVACVGDSITYGAGIENRETHSYPAQLQRILGEGFEVRNFGRSGATMLRVSNLPYWVTPQFEQAREFAPDIIILKLGTNDTKPFNWDAGRARFKDDYSDFLTQMSQLPSQPLIYICIPIPAFEIRWEIRPHIVEHEVIPMILEVAQAKDLETIDLYTAFLGHADLIPDHIHPNAEGASIIAQMVASQIQESQGK